MTTTRPQTITFKEWLALNPGDAVGVELKCSQCDGTGNCKCECGHEHDCPICDGEGKSKEARKLEEKYEAAVAADILKWESFFAKAGAK